MSGLIDSALSAINIDSSALSAIMENKLLMAAAPAIAVGTLSIGSRVAMGAMALGCKGASSVVSYIDGDLSEAINDTADELMSLAKRSFTLELQVGLGLTALTVAGIAISEFLFTQPEVTRLDKVTDFIGLTTPQYSNLEHITNFIGLTAPITRTDQVIAAASWVGEKIGNAYEYVPSARNVLDGYIAVCRTIDMICLEIIKAPFVITKYAVLGTAAVIKYTLLGTAALTKFTLIASLKGIALPFQIMFFCADKVNAFYQCLPTAETVVHVAALPFTTTFKIITWPFTTAYHIVTWPFITAYNIVSWPIIQAQYLATQIYDFAVAAKNAIFSPIETLGYVYEGLRDIVEKIQSVVTFLELDDSISQIVSWPFKTAYNIVAWPFVKTYNFVTYPLYLAGEIAEFIKDCFVWPVVAVKDTIFSPRETAAAFFAWIRSGVNEVSKLEF